MRQRRLRFGMVVVGVFVGMVAGAHQQAEAACAPVYEHDFVGQKCDSPGVVELTGNFSSDSSGGTLKGLVRVTSSGANYQVIKAGTLRSADFEGQLNRNEQKLSGITNITEERNGKHRLDDGGVLTGLVRLMDNGANYQVIKTGSVIGPLFKGTLNMSESKLSGIVSQAIDQRGEWPIGNGKKLVGAVLVQCSAGTCQVNDQRVTQ